MFNSMVVESVVLENLVRPLCDTDARVVITYVQRQGAQQRELEASDVLTSSYLPIEEFYPEVDRLEDELLRKVPYGDLDTVTISHITRAGKEFYTRPATEM